MGYSSKDGVRGDGDAIEPCDYSVVIPAKNAEGYLPKVLDAVWAASPPPGEVVVYDDGSSDRTSQIAEKHGARVIRNGGKSLGPARARNEGAEDLTSEFILFIDSDVVIEPDAPAHLCQELARDSDVAATFGAYGEVQAGSNRAAKYANLRHHYFHVHGDADAETFWTGLGAVRRTVFETMGGFDQSIDRPAMEDIEFGFRLRKAGHRVRIAARARGTHLKDWTVKQLWRDDVFSRAIPWSKMLIEGRGPATLNASKKEQIKAVLIQAALGSLVLGLVFPPFLWVSAAAFALFFYANLRFWRTLFRHAGWRTALAGAGLHTAYYIYSSVSFGLVFLGMQVERLSSSPAKEQAGSPTAASASRSRG